MKKSIIISALGLAVVAILIATPQAISADNNPQDVMSSRPGAIYGQVLDARGGKIMGAEVWLVAKDGTLVDRVTSSRSGGFKFTNIQAGAYTVYGNHRDMGTGKTDVTIRSGDEVQCEVILR